MTSQYDLMVRHKEHDVAFMMLFDKATKAFNCFVSFNSGITTSTRGQVLKTQNVTDIYDLSSYL